MIYNPYPLVPLGYVATTLAGGTPRTSERKYWDATGKGVNWVAIGDMSGTPLVKNTARRVTQEGIDAAGLTVGEPGTILFAMYASVGAVSRLGIPAAWNQALLGIKPRENRVHADYLAYSLTWLRPSLVFYLRSNTQDNLNAEVVKSLRLPLPDLETQRAIADYLDRETAEIDAMTADLDELEKLLAERRKATVTAAFNKFSTTAPLWKFAKVSPSTPGIYDLDKGEDVTFIPLEDVWTNQKPEVFKVAPWEDKLASYTHFESGDVLLPKVTPTVTHGRAMVANVTTKLGVATSEVYTLRPNERTNPDWLAFFLTSQTFLDEAGVSVLGTGGLKRISTQFVQSFPVPDMSRSEQDSLVKDIDRETAEIDAMLADITELRDLLAERRAALIAAAVTGQINIPAAKETTHA